MKYILPVAGFGSRLRPHTWSRPKPLFNIAGKTVLDHVLDRFKPSESDEVILIIGWLGDQIREYVDTHYAFKAHYVVQEELKGQAHAIYLAKELVSGPCFIVWIDTLFEADLSGLDAGGSDVVAYVMKVDDPRRFGVAIEKEGRVVRFIEKPDTCEHRKAVVGLYYIKEGDDLIDAIKYLMEQDIKTKGEFYLTDALQIMINRGAQIVCRPVSVWKDCGTLEAILQTHHYLLDNGHAQEIEVKNGLLIPPVHIAKTATIENAIVGPYVTVGDNARIRGAIVRDAIIEAGSTVENMTLEHSLVGRNATIVGTFSRLNVGDNDAIALNGENS